MTEEDLIRERDLAMKIFADSTLTEEFTQTPLESASISIVDDGVEEAQLIEFYKTYLGKYSHVCRKFPNEWKIIDEIAEIMSEVDSRWAGVGVELDAIDLEKITMLGELSELTGQSSKLLTEQKELEKKVYEMESRMHIARTVREVDLLTVNRSEISDFDHFASLVDSVEKSLVYLSGTMSPLHRQFEHLRFQLCSLGISVCTSTIDSYGSRLSTFISQQSSIMTNILFSKFVDSLVPVSRISLLFRSLPFYAFAVRDTEKKFEDFRESILTKIIASYKNSVDVRKFVGFVSSIGDQEASLFESIFPGSSPRNLHRWLGLALYAPLRSLVIGNTNVAELSEYAEIIRLELLPENPALESILCKLHRDIQERLIFQMHYHHESFSVDELIRNLSLLTGVLDNQTLHDLAHDGVRSVVSKLVPGEPKLVSSLVLIDQLLRLRELLTVIDCEYMASPKAVEAPLEDLLRATCEDFNRAALALPRDDQYVPTLKRAMADGLTLPNLEPILLKPILDILHLEENSAEIVAQLLS